MGGGRPATRAWVQVDIVIVSCSCFAPTPSLAAMLVNRFKFRHDVLTYNLSGMGCSTSVVAVDLAKHLLSVSPESGGSSCLGTLRFPARSNSAAVAAGDADVFAAHPRADTTYTVLRPPRVRSRSCRARACCDLLAGVRRSCRAGGCS